MELLTLYIAILALLVAIPGTIDATWNLILKIHALKKGEDLTPFKKITKSSLDYFSLTHPDADHFRPYSLGEDDSLSNLTFVCTSCHFKKSCNVS